MDEIDVPAVHQLKRGCRAGSPDDGTPASADDVAALLAASPTACWVAVVDVDHTAQWLVGYVLASASSNDDFETGSIAGFGVHRAYRGQGLGTTLLQTTVSFLEKEGCRRIRMACDDQQTAAKAAGAHVGFTPLWSISHYVVEL
ncbi:GNAT family N-acetyltransferase [Bounagaea algeriensis]